MTLDRPGVWYRTKRGKLKARLTYVVDGDEVIVVDCDLVDSGFIACELPTLGGDDGVWIKVPLPAIRKG